MSDVLPFNPKLAKAETPGLGKWSLVARLAFRFSFTYFAISTWFWLFTFSDKSKTFLAKPYWAICTPIARWTALHLYHWKDIADPNFVRDSRYLYALLTCFLVVSIATTVIWSVLDHRRTQYSVLNHWMRVFLRYTLAYILLHYGMDKIFLLQFPAPSLARLTERFGDYSPSSLMWAFIGSSVLYTIFGGVAEILGAVLLFARRTTTLGALIAFAVMFNVTVMDFSYDVSVKIFCINILMMAIYLIAPDTRRLLNFFFLNRATQPASLQPTNNGRTSQRLAFVLKVIVVVFLLVPLILRDWKSYSTAGPGAQRPPLYGLYEVDEFTLAGIVHPALVTDSTRWRFVIFEEQKVLTLKRMDDSLTNYRIEYNPTQHTIDISAPGDTADKSRLTVTEENAGGMTLEGNVGGAPVRAKLRRVDTSSFTLVNRGFHWISESSFVR